MRAIIEVLRSIGIWLATGGLGVRPLIITLPRPDTHVAPERGPEPRAPRAERRTAGV